MQQYLIGVYQEVGKKPDVIKIKSDKAYLEKLVGGEFTTLDYDDYLILYKKDNERLLPNIYVSRFSKIGLSIKGNIFIIGKDENNNFISLNKDQFKRCSEFLLRESFNYKNFDEKGRYIPKMKRNNKNNNRFNKNNNTKENKQYNTSQNNSSNSNINANLDNKEQSSTNDTTNNVNPIVRLSDEETLQVLNKMIYIIYDYLQKLMEIMSNNDD